MINAALYKRIIEKTKDLNRHKPFDKLQLQKLKEQFAIQYIYNSTAIEGNTITLQETELILGQGITIGGKSLREHLDITNQREALTWIEQKTKGRLLEADMLTLHRITLKGISDFWAGRYKTSQNRILGSRLKTTPPHKVYSEILNLMHVINKNPEKLNPIELSAWAHHEIARIHPFVDGNGRTARLLCNLILMKAGYPPVIIRNKDRKKYIDCLEKAHFGDLNPFVDFIGKAVEESLMLYLNAFERSTAEKDLVPLSELKTHYSQEYLSLLARRGSLSAVKINGAWHSSKKELGLYQKRRKYRIKMKLR
ncbi:MAG: Fic family protein [Nanoarchaeota archaeon]